MSKENVEKQEQNLQVTEGLTVAVIPSSDHEFLMSSEQVATGYGVSIITVRQHKKRQSSELIDGKHFVSGVTFCNSDPHNKVYWTKRGIMRLGFFIKSKQARMFRDWAEDLIIDKVEQPTGAAKRIKQCVKRLEEHYVEHPEYKPLLSLINQATTVLGSKDAICKRLGISAAALTHIFRRPWLISDQMQHTIELGCRNILNRNGKVDTEAIEQLIAIDDKEIRFGLFNKMRKGGLL